MKEIRVKPFLRWAGGKRWLVKKIDKYLPKKFNNYFEPFLGGGSIFFHIVNGKEKNVRFFLSDSNEELINCYVQIRDNIDNVIDIISDFSNTPECYYSVRERIPQNDIEKAARFFYLNQTSYNGIHRVNKVGKYNVPYGYRKNTLEAYCNFDNLKNVSRCLKKTELNHGDFFNSVDHAVSENDLVFLDPPYTVAHENNGFIHYNQRIFSWEDQERLAVLLDSINNKNAFYIMTNAAHNSIANLFADSGSYHQIQRSCNIGGTGARRTKVNEYIYTNIGGIL